MICSLFPVLQHSFTATINLHQIGHSGVRRAAVMARQVCAAEPDMACSLFQYWDDQLAPDETRNGTASVTQCVQLNQIWLVRCSSIGTINLHQMRPEMAQQVWHSVCSWTRYGGRPNCPISAPLSGHSATTVQPLKPTSSLENNQILLCFCTDFVNWLAPLARLNTLGAISSTL